MPASPPPPPPPTPLPSTPHTPPPQAILTPPHLPTLHHTHTTQPILAPPHPPTLHHTPRSLSPPPTHTYLWCDECAAGHHILLQPFKEGALAAVGGAGAVGRRGGMAPWPHGGAAHAPGGSGGALAPLAINHHVALQQVIQGAPHALITLKACRVQARCGTALSLHLACPKP